MRFRRNVFAAIGAVAVAWLMLCALVGIAGTEMALHPGRRQLDADAENRTRAFVGQQRATLSDIEIPADDGLVLHGWIIKPFNANGDVVLLLHGMGDNRLGMLGYADLFLHRGYTVLLPDARGHGQSGGDLATYGVREADDIQRWFDWAQKTLAPRCIDGLGESMGAAQLLESLKVERRFCAVVAESPFASFREASYDRIGQWCGAGPWLGRTILRPAVTIGFVYAELRYQVDLGLDNPEDAVAATSVPVLLIHGKRDDNLPPRHSEEIQRRSEARGREVELWQPAEAGHTGAAGAEPAEFERRVIGWFQQHDSQVDDRPVRF